MISILFLPLHTAPFFYVKLYFGVLYKHGADVMRSNTLWGSKPPHLQIGASNCFKFGVNVLVTIDLFCSSIFTLSVTEIQLCKVNAHFPARFAPTIYANCVQFNVVWWKSLVQIERENVQSFSEPYLRNDKVKINKQKKSIVTGPLYVHTEFEAIWTLLPEDVAVLNPTGYHTS